MKTYFTAITEHFKTSLNKITKNGSYHYTSILTWPEIHEFHSHKHVYSVTDVMDLQAN